MGRGAVFGYVEWRGTHNSHFNCSTLQDLVQSLQSSCDSEMSIRPASDMITLVQVQQGEEMSVPPAPVLPSTAAAESPLSVG